MFEEVSPDAFSAQNIAAGTPEFLLQEYVEMVQGMNELGCTHILLSLAWLRGTNMILDYAGRPLLSFDKLPRKTRTWKEFVATQYWSKFLPV